MALDATELPPEIEPHSPSEMRFWYSGAALQGTARKTLPEILELETQSTCSLGLDMTLTCEPVWH